MTESKHRNDGQGFKPSARRKARRFTMQALYEWQMTRNTVADIEARYCAENDMRKTDVGYFHELLSEITRQADVLENQLRPCLDRDPAELDPVERAILRIGAYELVHRIDIPYRVVINEAIELAKDFGATDGHKYVNGVLDKLALSVRKVERS